MPLESLSSSTEVEQETRAVQAVPASRHGISVAAKQQKIKPRLKTSKTSATVKSKSVSSKTSTSSIVGVASSHAATAGAGQTEAGTCL